MIMRAKEQGNAVILELEGHLDVESTALFQTTCADILKKDPSKKMILNMEKLRFVGSTGINQFVDAIKSFNKFPLRPRMCKISADFLKVLRAYQTTRNPFEFFDNEESALLSFEIPSPQVTLEKKPRKKQIEN